MRFVRPLLALVAVTAVAGCANGSADDAAASRSGPPDLPDHRGRIVVVCEPSHHAPDDPIVHPGEPGASHLHEFFGNVAVDARSTTAGIARAETTCATAADRAAYWVPALLEDGIRRVPPEGIDAYYRAGRGVDPVDVVAYPHGLRVVAGDAHTTDAQPTGIAGWSCSANPERHERPPGCAGALRMRVTFPDCWNGEDLDSDDHASHMAYSDGDGCPASHGVAVPQLEVVVRYPALEDDRSVRLASGDPITAHADFWNVWEPAPLEREVEACLHLDVVCGDARS